MDCRSTEKDNVRLWHITKTRLQRFWMAATFASGFLRYPSRLVRCKADQHFDIKNFLYAYGTIIFF